MKKCPDCWQMVRIVAPGVFKEHPVGRPPCVGSGKDEALAVSSFEASPLKMRVLWDGAPSSADREKG